jgi:hypothetical protein
MDRAIAPFSPNSAPGLPFFCSSWVSIFGIVSPRAVADGENVRFPQQQDRSAVLQCFVPAFQTSVLVWKEGDSVLRSHDLPGLAGVSIGRPAAA